jgi:carboxymethylenebutenolidase
MISLTRPEGSQPEDFHLSRRGIASLLFTGYAVAALSAKAEPIHTDETGLVSETVMINKDLPAYVVRPAGGGRRGAVVVVSEIFGLHEWVRDIARRLAHAGYVAIAPNFFFRADPDNHLPGMSDFGAILKIVATAKSAQVTGDVKATLDWLKAQPFVDAHRLALTGYCWGGAVAWTAAEALPDLRASAAWYGSVRARKPGEMMYEEGRVWPIEGVKSLKCPVIGFYGGKDQGIPAADLDAMKKALAEAGQTRSQINIYPEAEHGFLADYRASYNAAAAKDAWARMLAFFKENGV